MRFDIKQARDFLKENGFCFSVRSYDYGKMSHKKVKGIGTVLVRKIGEVEFDFELMDYIGLSGFDEGLVLDNEVLDNWWNTIEKYCKGKRKYLYLVVVENE